MLVYIFVLISTILLIINAPQHARIHFCIDSDSLVLLRINAPQHACIHFCINSDNPVAYKC